MIYYLNNENVPTIPVPNDCVIKKVAIQDDHIVFELEDDISHHDSFQHINNKAKSLIVKIHLTDSFDTYTKKHYKIPRRKNAYVCIDNKKLETIAKRRRLEYLYHDVGYNSIIIKLFCETFIMIDISADYIEYEWIE